MSSMEEIMSMVLRGCHLAKELEANLANMANQPGLIARSCDDIIRVFLSVRDRLNNGGGDGGGGGVALYHHHQQHHQMMVVPAGGLPVNIDPSNLQELLRSSVTQAMDLFQHRHVERTAINPFETVAAGGGDYNMEGSTSSSSRLRGMGGGRGGGGGDGHVQLPLMEVSGDSSVAAAGRGGGGGGGSSSSSQRSHRRSDNARTERVPAPRYGNTEIPPEDGYTWRKYGQKEILNSKFPRSYYRCTHQKLYNCPAKKQVQRLDDDPYTFEVTYNGEHTCHMSSTAPSAPPSAAVARPQDVTQEMTQTITMQQPSPNTTTLNTWLSMELGTGRSGSGSSGGGVAGSSGAGPSSSSAVRFDREGEHPYLNVANMADAMFNSGSSSSNSMEFLFPNMEDHK